MLVGIRSKLGAYSCNWLSPALNSRNILLLSGPPPHKWHTTIPDACDPESLSRLMFKAHVLNLPSRTASHLLFAARNNIVLRILRICLDLDALLTAWCCHCERPYLCAVIFADLLFLSIESYSLAYQVSTPITPHIEWHFKPAGAAYGVTRKATQLDMCSAKQICKCSTLETSVVYLMTKMPWSIFLALSLKGCWPCCLFMLPFLGSHSGGK